MAQKIKIPGAVKATAKAFGYAVGDTLADYNPVITNIIRETRSAKSRAMSDIKTNSKISPILSMISTGKDQNLSGNYNTTYDEEAQSNMSYEDWGDDDASDASSTQKMIAEAASSRISASQVDRVGSSISKSVGSSISKSANYIVRQNAKATQALYSLNQAGFNNVNTLLLNLNNTVEGIARLGEPITQHVQNSSVFFTNTSKSLQNIEATLAQIEKNTHSYAPTGRYSGRGNKFGNIGGGAEYYDMVKANWQEFGHLFSEVISGAKEASGMRRSGISSTRNTPRGLGRELGTWLMKGLLPTTLKDAFSELNTALIDSLQVGIASFAKGAKKRGGVAELLSKLFLPQDGFKTKINSSNYEKGPVQWDGIARQSLIEVIPTMLFKIYGQMTGLTGNDEIRYDYKNGRFINLGKVKRRKDYEMMRMGEAAGGSIRKEALYNASMSQNKDKDRIENEVDMFFHNAAVQGWILDNIEVELKNSNYRRAHGISAEAANIILKTLKQSGRGSANALRVAAMRERTAQGNRMQAHEANGGIYRTLDNGSDFTGAKYQEQANMYLKGIYYNTLILASNMSFIGGKTNNVNKIDLNSIKDEIQKIDIKQQEKDANMSAGNMNDSSYRNSLKKEFEYDDMSDEEIELAELEKQLASGDLGRVQAAQVKEQIKQKKIKLERSAIGRGVGKTVGKMQELAKNPLSALTGLINKMTDGITSIFWGGQGRGGILDTVLDGIHDFFDPDGEKQGTFFSTIRSQLDAGMSNIAAKLGDHIGRMFFGENNWQRRKEAKAAKRQANEAAARAQEFGTSESFINSIFQGNAANGRKITRTGIAAVSEGELIIPAEYNPFYHGRVNKRDQYRKENRAISKFFGAFADGGEVGKDRGSSPIKGVSNIVKGLKKKISHNIQKYTYTIGLDANGEEVYVRTNKKTGKEQEITFAEYAVGVGNDVAEKARQNLYNLDLKGKAQAAKDAVNNFKENRFKGGIGQGVVGNIGAAASTLSSGVVNFINACLGTSKEDQEKDRKVVMDKIQTVFSEAKDNTGNMLVGAIAGGGVSLLTGALVGPLAGAAVGAGIGLIKNSESVRKALFGEPDEKGNYEKPIAQFLTHQLEDVAAGASLGGVLGTVFMGSPVMGALLGSAAGYIRSSETAKEFLFGNAEKGKDGAIPKELQEKIKKIAPNIGAGMMGMAIAGPFGMLPNLMFGAGLGFLSTSSNFQKFLFGDGKEDKGLAGQIHEKIIKNIDSIFRNLGNNVKGHLTTLAGKIGGMLKNLLVGRAKAARGSKGIVGKIVRGSEKLIKAPVTVAGAVLGKANKKIQRRNLKKGYGVYDKNYTDGEARNLFADERLNKRANEHIIGGRQYANFDRLLASAETTEDLDMLQEALGMVNGGQAANKFANKMATNSLYRSMTENGEPIVDPKTQEKLGKLLNQGNFEEADKLMKQIGGSLGDKSAAKRIGQEYSKTRAAIAKNNKATFDEKASHDLFKQAYGIDVTDANIGLLKDQIANERKNSKFLEDPAEQEKNYKTNIQGMMENIMLNLYNLGNHVDPIKPYKMRGEVKSQIKGLSTLIKDGKRRANGIGRAVDGSEVDQYFEDEESGQGGDEGSGIGRMVGLILAAQGLKGKISSAGKRARTTITQFGIIRTFKDKNGEEQIANDDSDTVKTLKKQNEYQNAISGIPKITGIVGGMAGAFGALKDKLIGNKEKKEKGIFGQLMDMIMGGGAIKTFLSGIGNTIGGIFGADSAVGGLVKTILNGQGVGGFLKGLLLPIAAIGGLSLALTGKLDDIGAKIIPGMGHSDAVGGGGMQYFTYDEYGNKIELQQTPDGKLINPQTGKIVSKKDAFTATGDVANVKDRTKSLIARDAVRAASGEGSKTVLGAIAKKNKSVQGIINGAKKVKNNIAGFIKKRASKGAGNAIEAGASYVMESADGGLVDVMGNNLDDGAKTVAKGLSGKMLNAAMKSVDSAMQTLSKLLTKLPFGIGAKLAGSGKIGEFVTKMSKSLVGIIKGGGKKVMAAIAKAAPVIGWAFAISDFITGWQDANATLQISAEPTLGQKVYSGLLRLIKNQVPFVGPLIPDSLLSDLLCGFIGPIFGFTKESLNKQQDDAQQELAEYNEANGTNLTFDQYNKQVLDNKTFTERIGDFASETKYKITHSKVGKAIGGGAKKVGGAIVGGAKKAGGAIVSGIKGAGNLIGKGLGAAKDGAGNVAKNGISAIGQLLGYVKSGDLGGLIKAKFEPKDEDNPTNGFFKGLFQVSKMFVTVPTAMSAGYHKIWEAVTGIAGGIKDQAKLFMEQGKKVDDMVSGKMSGGLANFFKVDHSNISKGNVLAPVFDVLTIGRRLIAAPPVLIKYGFKSLVNGVKNIADKAKNGVSTLASLEGKAFEYAKSGNPSKLWSSELKDDEGNPVGGVLKGVYTGLKIVNTPISAIAWVGKKVKSLVGTVVDGAKSAFTTLGEMNKQSNEYTKEGNITGLLGSKFQDDEGNPVGGLAGGIYGAMKFAKVIPTGIVWAGKKISHLVSGIIGGAKDTFGAIGADMTKMSKYADDGDIASIWDYKLGSESNNTGFGPVVNVLGTLGKIVFTAVGGIHMIVNPIINTVKGIKEKLGDVIGDIKNGIGDFFSGLGDFFGGIFDDAKEVATASGGRSGLPVRGAGASGIVSQNDKAYSGYRVGGKTMSQNGCAPASALMALGGSGNAMGDAVGLANKYQTRGGTDVSYFKDVFNRSGIGSSYVTGRNVKNAVSSGNPVVLMGQDKRNTSKLNSPFGPNNHYVVADGMHNGKVVVRDPEMNQVKEYSPRILNNVKIGVAAHGSGMRESFGYNPFMHMSGGASGQNERAVWLWLRSQGIEAKAAAAIMGCWKEESNVTASTVEGHYLKSFPGAATVINSQSAMDSYTTGPLFSAYASSGLKINKAGYNGGDGHYYPGIGLAQWTGPRAKRLFDYANQKGMNWGTYGAQLDFFMNGPSEFGSRGLKSQMNNAKSVKDATAIFFDNYEMSKGAHTKKVAWFNKRTKNAEAFYNKFKNETSNGGAIKFDDSSELQGGAVAASGGDGSSGESSGGYLDQINSAFSTGLGTLFGASQSSGDGSSGGVTATGDYAGNVTGAKTEAGKQLINKFISSAVGEIGTTEKGNNNTKYGAFTGAQNQPWCASFVDWNMSQAAGGKENAQKVMRGPLYAAVSGLWDNFKKAGAMTNTPEPGDIVIYKNGSSHTGLVETVNGNKITTIEGNTSGGSGFSRNGGMVARKEFDFTNKSDGKAKHLTGFGRPNWDVLSGGSSGLPLTGFAGGASGTKKSTLKPVKMTASTPVKAKMAASATAKLTSLGGQATAAMQNGMITVDVFVTFINAITKLLQAISDNTAPVEKIYKLLNANMGNAAKKSAKASAASSSTKKETSKKDEVDQSIESLVGVLADIAKG